jgi:hypothetical protein
MIFANTTTMYHPMHIHGHTFQLGPAGPRKDTVIVRPGQQVACDFDAVNPGQWMTHCHNLYHAPQGGMMAMGSATGARVPRGCGGPGVLMLSGGVISERCLPDATAGNNVEDVPPREDLEPYRAPACPSGAVGSP